MSTSSKRKKNLWYGYLEAGANSSPVIRDDGLNTGNPKTVYLFNLARGRILEYSREIVEPKLRELNGKEAKAIAKLEAGFAEARRDFKDRSARILNIPERGSPARKPVQQDEEEPNFGDFADDETSDASWLDAQAE
jgi:hypothetical protein